MSQPNFKSKELYLILGLIVLIIVLFAFKSRSATKNVSGSIFDQTLDYNSAFGQLPEPYEKFIENEPIDIILDSTEGRFEKIKALKFDAYFSENDMYRELVLIKKVTPRDTLLEPIRFDVYPTERKQGKRKYISYTANSITYSYNGANYHVARQVLPNIEITKIVPYTKNWQTTISEVDNSMLSSKEAAHLKPVENGKIDSLAIGLDIKTSVYGFLFGEALKDNSISFLSLDQNLKNTDVLNGSESFKTFAKKENLRLLYISDDITFWESLTQTKELPKPEFLNTTGSKTRRKLDGLLLGNLAFADVFDIEKLAAYYALLNLYSNRTENSLYLNFNENTDLLEPYHMHKDFGQLNTYIKNLKIQDIGFAGQYAQQLARIASLENTLELVADNRKELKKMLEIIHQTNPMALFDQRLFTHNKLIIEKALNPSTTTKIALLSHDTKQMEVEIENLTNFPIEIAELSYKQNKFITGPNELSDIIMPLEKQNVIFDLPDSYDNLFVQKKKKTTGFIFGKDIFDLAIGYRLVGTNTMKYNTITPFMDLDELAPGDDLFRMESDISSFEFLMVDESKREITFTTDSIVLNRPLLLPEGYVIKARPGLQIDIVNGGKIISKSRIHFIGSEERPIKIYSSDKKGQGLFVIGVKEISELRHVSFDNLTNQSHGLWDLTGAVVFYESPVNLDYVMIANNSCEDGLNIIRTHFTMKNTTFRNTQSDAFDGDFVQGTLTNCTFENLGNDGIDVSGSKLELYNLKITKAGDKALSAGEDSQMQGSNIKIDSCEIAIAGKDLSLVQLSDVTISNSKLGFTAFQKKPEFGASNIEAKNVVMTQVETPHLIEIRSSLLLNGEQSETVDAVKEQMYGVEFGIDSKETRVKKKE